MSPIWKSGGCMPNPIDRCGACRQPLYVEANVPGGCDCHDRDFRILLAEQRRRNSSGNEDFASSFSTLQDAPDLSEIDPGLLMSAAGRNEFEAAQSLRPTVPTLRKTPATPASGRQTEAAMFDDSATWGPPGQTNPVTPQDDEIELGDDDWTGDWNGSSRHNARVASSMAAGVADVDLSAMWMQGTGIPFDRTQLITPDHLDDFSFDTGEMRVDAGAYPRGGGVGGGRFRVDQAPPARGGFNNTTIPAAGGVEVSRIRAGRFQVVRERPARPEPPPPPSIFEQIRAEVAEPAPPPRQESRPLSAVQQAREVQARSRGPSVYDRLRTNPFGK